MAKGKNKSESAKTDTESTGRVGALHQAHADYIKENKGIDVTAEQVFAVYSTRVPFRKSDEYRVGVREAKEAERAAAAKAKEEAAAKREAAREAKAAEKEAAKAAKAKEKEAASSSEKSETKPAKKAATKKAAKGKGKGKTDSPF